MDVPSLAFILVKKSNQAKDIKMIKDATCKPLTVSLRSFMFRDPVLTFLHHLKAALHLTGNSKMNEAPAKGESS